MKKLLVGFVGLLSLHVQADIVSLITTNNSDEVTVTVEQGQFCSVRYVTSNTRMFFAPAGSGKFELPVVRQRETDTTGNVIGVTPAYIPVIAGPGIVSFIGGNSTNLVTVEIKPQSFDVGQTVIVPAGTAATIHFEESFDLKTWSNTFTTNYMAGSTNRFFRLRAVRQ